MDIYCSYDELRLAETADAFAITIIDRNTPAVIVAPHGGNIEPGTTEIARAVAGDAFSSYSFDGRKGTGNFDLHITSIRFDEPMALALVARSEFCVTVHGAAGTEPGVYLGGRDEALKVLLHVRLSEAGFQVFETTDPDLQGTSPINICNRGASRAGAQLEITRALRDSLTDATDPRSPERLDAFAAAVRAAIDADSVQRCDPVARSGSARR